MTPATSTTYDLAVLPEGSTLHSVTATPAVASGRTALRVELTDAVTLQGAPHIDYVDMPTFVALPAAFENGTIEVDILSRLNGKGPPDARAFAGIAYRIAGDHERFEAVYVRPLNGSKASPPPPRDQRAVQYFAYPEWKYERLREKYPDGRYEAGADIGPDEWIHLKIDVDTQVKVTINGTETLAIADTKGKQAAGSIGLFVDIGTEAFFSNLVLAPH
jgi:hypothetical protein